MKRLTREIIEVIVLTIIIIIAVRFFVQGYHIEGKNMQPSLNADQFVLVNKSAYFFRGIERGDVVVIHSPRNPQQDVIVRVIGLPGDTIRMDSQSLQVNGVTLKEGYVKTPLNPFAREWKVSPDHYFVLNDNRAMEGDSRTWDPLPRDYIVGKAIFNFWPLNEFHSINTYNDTYKAVR